MGIKIACIPADNENKLWLKDLRVENNKTFVKYKSTYNDMPFVETQIYAVDGGDNFAITGDDGTIIFRFSAMWLDILSHSNGTPINTNPSVLPIKTSGV